MTLALALVLTLLRDSSWVGLGWVGLVGSPTLNLAIDPEPKIRHTLIVTSRLNRNRNSSRNCNRSCTCSCACTCTCNRNRKHNLGVTLTLPVALGARCKVVGVLQCSTL